MELQKKFFIFFRYGLFLLAIGMGKMARGQEYNPSPQEEEVLEDKEGVPVDLVGEVIEQEIEREEFRQSLDIP